MAIVGRCHDLWARYSWPKPVLTRDCCFLFCSVHSSAISPLMCAELESHSSVARTVLASSNVRDGASASVSRLTSRRRQGVSLQMYKTTLLLPKSINFLCVPFMLHSYENMGNGDDKDYTNSYLVHYTKRRDREEKLPAPLGKPSNRNQLKANPNSHIQVLLCHYASKTGPISIRPIRWLVGGVIYLVGVRA